MRKVGTKRGGVDSESLDTKSQTELQTRRTRRSLLGAGVALIATTSLAGCSTSPKSGGRPTPDTGDDDPEGPAAYIWSDWNEDFYHTDLFRLPDYEGGDFNLDSGTIPYSSHPDTEAVQAEFSDTDLTINFRAVITRPVNLVAHIVSPAWDDNHTNEDFITDSPRVYEEALDPTPEYTLDEDSEADNIEAPTRKADAETHEHHFDVSHLDLPTDVSVHAHIILEDPGIEGHGRFNLLTHHTAARLRYQISRGERTRWLNTEAARNVISDPPNDAPQRNGAVWPYSDHFNVGNERVTYYVQRYNGEYYCAAFTVHYYDLQHYERNGGDSMPHAIRAANNAYSDDRMTWFAQQLWDGQTTLGITDILDRMNSTLRVVRNITYKREGMRRYDYALTEYQANCTEKTAILGAILRCDPFNIRLAYIDCELVGLGLHLVGGIDLNDLDESKSNIDTLDTFNPRDYSKSPNDIPAREYAFVEATGGGSDVGEYTPADYHIRNFVGTNYKEGSNDPNNV